MSRFDNIPTSQPDAAFQLIEAYKIDESPYKVDLCPGFYRDEKGRPWVLPSAKFLLNDDDLDHEHLPLLGHTDLLRAAQHLLFDPSPQEASHIASIQTIAGTGANHLAALVLAKTCRPRRVWISDPTWINHHEIWRTIDDTIERTTYPYFDHASFRISFDDLLSLLRSEAREGDAIILHACAHNPTGTDFSREQWQAVAEICEEKRLLPVFDSAYQGFATGSLADDAWSMRYFMRHTSLDFLVAQSFSKNFGLYGERVGALHVVCRSQSAARNMSGLLTRLSRAEITSAPINGARIIAKILTDEKLKRQWQQDLHHMSGRMASMRQKLFDGLHQRKTPGSWDHILTDIGMFSMTGFGSEQIRMLKENYHIYMLPSGRLSVTGLTEYNIDHVVDSFDSVANVKFV
ncbi:Aspartate aminotransferase-like protein 1 [Elsinoe fawcettii]|nr:Aspartate aminotransferase-like protein 1 [Elsinoe fawcettii]